jgi:hypothetical protein
MISTESKTSTLVKHIETHLGRIEQGWSTNESDNIQILKIRNKPTLGVSIYSTLGLSNHILQMPKRRRVRQELICICRESFNSSGLVSFLYTLGESVLNSHTALLRGQVIGPNQPIMNETTMSAVYSAIPVVLDEAFATYRLSSPPTVFVWLIPLYAEEAIYIGTNGWDAFENLLVKEDPDLYDLKRQQLVLP